MSHAPRTPRARPIQRRRAGLEQPAKLVRLDDSRGILVRCSHVRDVQLFSQHVGKAPAQRAGIGAGFRLPAVADAPMVEAQAACHHDQPGGELGVGNRLVGAQPPALVRSQPLENLGVRIHRGVVVVRH
ncbi:MAG: hypothetical protein AABY85_09320 [Gemmatimonadota bacterium]